MAPLCGGVSERHGTTGDRSGTAGGGGDGFWFDQLVVTLIKIDEDHSVTDRTPDRLRRPAGATQAPVGADLVVVLEDDDDRLSEQGDHQRIAMAGECREQIDEVPP